MPISRLFEQDFFAWANEQAALLRAGKLDRADIDHIAEEIESMGRAEKRELANRLAVLLTHLLKWRFQPSLRGTSWRLTIEERRRALARDLSDNPSLKAQVNAVIEDAYGDAVLRAARDTGNDKTAFPSVCLWTYEQIADSDFWPDES